jgi:predicted nucleotide-binding protein
MNEIDPSNAINKIILYTDQIENLLQIPAPEGERVKTQLETRIKGFVRAVFKDDDKKIQDLEKDRNSRKSRYPRGERSQQLWYVIDLDVLKDHLLAYKEELELMNKSRDTTSQLISQEISSNRKIFIVHGQNEGIKNDVEQFLKSLDLDPIILHKQANLGKTIIEKMEHYSEVSFAIILLDGDDIGTNVNIKIEDIQKAVDKSDIKSISEENIGSITEKQKMSFFIIGAILAKIIENASPRARQNVIFEFGYFIGLLGRSNVRALYQEGVELPSDIHGMLYIPFDNKGIWKKKLAKEIDAAGIKIDEKYF